jgi:hypothetical protein
MAARANARASSSSRCGGKLTYSLAVLPPQIHRRYRWTLVAELAADCLASDYIRVRCAEVSLRATGPPAAGAFKPVNAS